MNTNEVSYEIHLQAKRFEDSAELLFKTGINNPKSYFIPAWVLAAFSLELHLKSILQFEKGEIIRTHSIKDIFKNLSNESQMIIKENFKIDIILNPPLNLKEIELHSGIKIPNDFDENLNEISSLFVDFRYIFEFENKEKSFMYIDNLRRVITARVSELNIDKK
ncbi:MAG: HEPN domain-containing protein [Aequorivita sp.]|nr:HEPN domain-containing protein [Aequorivita sp.]